MAPSHQASSPNPAAPEPAPPDNIWSWSEAAVCDRLFGLYASAFADPACARRAARLHLLCWRAYLNALGAHGCKARQALARMMTEAKLDPALLDRADTAVADELTDLVLHRYRRAPEQAKVYITALIAGAARMAASRVT
jgi:hypothetical protein